MSAAVQFGAAEHKSSQEQLEHEAHKMEAIGRLVGGVAHDFNNLLTGITLYCDLLLSGLEKGSQLHHYAQEIRAAGDHGAAMIQQLLAVARQQVVEPRNLSLNRTILEMRDLLSRLIGENIVLQVRLAQDLSDVRIDPAQAQQIVLNLVLNARDAMPQGGRVRIETRELEREVELQVADNGSGMSRETLTRLFEPFFTTKKAGQGNGLGLATIHTIIQQNQGTIQVHSRLGHGSRFVVRLPKAEGASEQPGSGQRRAERVCETILLVEDNTTVRESACRVLKAAGYTVIEARNGREALKAVRTFTGPIHLLITDVVMPGMTGREVAHQLCAQRPDLRVIYVTGYDQRNGARTRDAGILLHKPFSRAVLLKKVRETIDSRLHAAVSSTRARDVAIQESASEERKIS